jgi:hypothetical protein
LKHRLRSENTNFFCRLRDKHTATFGLGKLSLFAQAFYLFKRLLITPLDLTVLDLRALYLSGDIKEEKRFCELYLCGKNNVRFDHLFSLKKKLP